MKGPSAPRLRRSGRDDGKGKHVMSARPFDAEQFVRQYETGTAKLTAAYGYNPAEEIDSCGVGLVVALDGKRRRDVVAAGIDALKAVWHRGAVDADGKTGDGAGIHVEIPQDFFREHVRDSRGEEPELGRIAVGMVFLPRTDLRRAGALPHHRRDRDPALRPSILGWRQVPVDISVIGEKANATRPEIEQILIGRGNPALDNREFEKQLYILRRRMEKAAIAENIAEFYVCSLSCRSRRSTRACSWPSTCRPSIPTCSTSASSRASRSSTSATRPTPSRSGSSPSRSACWRTTARSTPSWATSTG